MMEKAERSRVMLLVEDHEVWEVSKVETLFFSNEKNGGEENE